MADETPPPAEASPAPPEAAPAPARAPEPPPPEPLDWFGTPRPGELREHYRPAATATRLTLVLAPWFDVLLLTVATVLFHLATALVPGQPADFLAAPAGAGGLPAAGIPDGARSSLVVVVRALPAPAVRDRRAAAAFRAEAFFRDERFNLSLDPRRAAFRSALAEAVRSTGEDRAVVYMDGSVTHQDAVRLSALLREAGLAGASFVTRPE